MISGQSLRFDQRPGALEATRGFCPGILVTGSRDERRHGGAWSVLCAVRGEDGTFCQLALTPEAARRAAAELIEMADVLEGHTW